MVQFALYKKGMASLRTIVRIIGKIDFKKPTQLDKSNWMYRYSHPYIRVLGPKEATVYLNEINSPVSVDPKVHPWYQKQNRFNVPLPVGTPMRRGLTRPTEANSDNQFFRSTYSDQEPIDNNKELKLMAMNSLKEIDSMMEPNTISPLIFNKIGETPTPRDNVIMSERRPILRLPIPVSEENISLNHSHFIFQSNSHFKIDGLMLDLAMSPKMREIDGKHFAFNSNKSSPLPIELRVIAESEFDDGCVEDPDPKPIYNQQADCVQSNPQYGSREFFLDKISSNRQANTDKRLTLEDVKDKQGGPMPFDKTYCIKTKAEGRAKLNLINLSPREDEDKQQGVRLENQSSDEMLTVQNRYADQLNAESIAVESCVRGGAVYSTRLLIADQHESQHYRQTPLETQEEDQN